MWWNIGYFVYFSESMFVSKHMCKGASINYDVKRRQMRDFQKIAIFDDFTLHNFVKKVRMT